MGMSFDKAVDRLEDLHFEQDNWEYEELTEDCLLNKEALRLAIDTMRKYQKLQVDYENRLKADLEAILVDLQSEIHELENPYPHDYDNLLLLAQHNAFYDAKSTIEDLVDEKINKLKEAD